LAGDRDPHSILCGVGVPGSIIGVRRGRGSGALVRRSPLYAGFISRSGVERVVTAAEEGGQRGVCRVATVPCD